MEKTILNLLTKMRVERGFDAKHYLEQKTIAINNFFREEGLDAAVIGVSGGVDSAVVYRLLVHASKQQDSPIKKIWALIMPICTDGTSNQDETIRLGCNTILKEPTTDYKIIDLTHVQNAYLNAAKYKNEEFINTWNSGQLASIVRTPCLYYHAALLQSGGYKSVVVGTTNRDEGAYVGFFGKASDGMVDLQPIADIHKSEVWEIARLLDVPSEIVNRAPQGDVWDGEKDEDMIGAPYWFLEAYVNAIDAGIALDDWTADDAQETVDNVNRYVFNIENIHTKNLHKYKVGSPARFVDVMPRKFIGTLKGKGW